MPFEYILVLIAHSLSLGFVLGFFCESADHYLEDRYRAELERWKVEAGAEIRKDSVNRSRSTLKGKIAEQLAPVLLDFFIQSSRCPVYRFSCGLHYL